VCKGQLSGYNIFICSSCDTLYCQNCARALEDLENECWVCNEPINKSKPAKSYEIDEKGKDFEKLVKDQTDSKHHKNS
jgi:predicted amidophosphoribosyltransferase